MTPSSPLCLRAAAMTLSFAVAILAASCGGTFDAGKGDSAVAPGGSCSEDGQRADAKDGCNTCTCSDGAWACTEMACVQNDGGAAECQPGATRAAGDGCNTCSCTDAGSWACTRMACPECRNGETKAQDCNTCTCMNGSWGCTLMECQPPPPPPECNDGDVKRDACMTCSCEGGSWMCTGAACPPPPPPPVCSDGDSMFDGCNTCTCVGGSWACTDMACPPNDCGGRQPEYDGCNWCSCMDGAWLCTLRACPPPAMDAGSAVVFCGGWSGDTCTDTEYCAYEEGQHCGAADASSVCTPRPLGCEDVYDPVCGCDGITHSNACEAAVKGTGILQMGPCPVVAPD